MGVLGSSTLAAGGTVTGVIPYQLVDRELAHPEVSDMRIVSSMHERKAMMTALADAFMVLPGGVGTLDEAFEAITWAKLGIHSKAIAFLNISGYFDGLFSFLDRAHADGFVETRKHLGVSLHPDIDGALLALDAFQSLDECSKLPPEP